MHPLRLRPLTATIAVLTLAALACGPLDVLQPTATPLIPTPTAEPPTATVEPTSPPDTSSGAGLLIQQWPNTSITRFDPATLQTSAWGDPGVQLFAVQSSLGVANGKLYVLPTAIAESGPGIIEFGPDGARRDLEQYGPNVAGLAVYELPGAPDHPLIAAGTADWQQTPPFSRLMISPVDGFDALLVREYGNPDGYHDIPWRWSADGNRLYFSEEPTGLGGYILFGGYSSLNVYDQTTNETSTLLPSDVAGGVICLDDISPDETLVAHHCSTTSIGVVNLDTGDQRTIEPPAGIEVGAAGSARFSPDGTRLAFAAARNNPDSEMGWVAVSDTLEGPARLLTASAEGDYYSVIGWWDATTLILQSDGGAPTVWLLNIEDQTITSAGEGYYLATLPAQ